MSLGKKQYEKAYKRNNKQVVKEEEQSEYDAVCGYWDYWDETHDYDCDHCKGPSLKDVAIGRLLTILSKLRIRGTKDKLNDWYW